MKSKSPAFQFYPQDYLSSARVAEMTLEEEGVYIRLLCYCWSSGSIPADPERCARLAGKGCSTPVATTVQRAFSEHPTDSTLLVHDRLDVERENQRIRREQASEAGKKSAEARAINRGNGNKNAIDQRPLNERSTNVQRKSNTSSSSSSSSSNKTQDFVFPSDLDTTEFRAAWTDWVEFRKEIKHGLTAKTIEAQMKKFAKWGVAKSIAAIRKSIENGWQGLFEPTEGPAAANGTANFEDDWDEVKAIVLEKYHPDVRCTKRIEQILTPEQFKAVIEVSPRKIWDSDRFDKVVPAAYRRARKGQL